MTNGDRIRQMSNEELAKLLNEVCVNHCNHPCSVNCRWRMCEEGIKAYLDMEVEDEPRESH